MPVSNKENAADQKALERAISRYYSHRPADIEEANQIAEMSILSGKVKANDHPIDIVNIVLLGARESEYGTSMPGAGAVHHIKSGTALGRAQQLVD